jgi:hypothetical protein
MTIYVFTDSRGTSHDIKQCHLEEAYRTLLLAGFEMHEAHDKSLDYVIACLSIQAVPEESLLYGDHDLKEESVFTSLVAHRLMIRQTSKESNETNQATK